MVRSWLFELCESAFGKDPKLDAIKGYVDDSGEGRWTVIEAIDEACRDGLGPFAVRALLVAPARTPFANKVIAALRNEFGGHAVKKG